MRRIVTGLCIILVLSGATLAHSELVDIKEFGQCAVATEVDDFTDEKSPQLYCLGNGDGLGEYGVFVTCLQQRFGTGFQAGLQFHTDKTTDVLYRFDKGKLATESWRYSGNTALTFDEGVHHHFVESIAKAKKLVFKVGKEAASVDLTGNLGATTEYKKRCAALGRPIK